MAKGFSMSTLVEESRDIIGKSLLEAVKPRVTSSFQADCVALVHMLNEVSPGIPVLFLDTGYHFQETYAYRDEMVERPRLEPGDGVARLTRAAPAAPFGLL